MKNIILKGINKTLVKTERFGSKKIFPKNCFKVALLWKLNDTYLIKFLHSSSSIFSVSDK